MGFALGLFSLILSACNAPEPLKELQPGETGRVVRIIDGDALILNTGQSVRLIAIEAPALRPRDRDPDPYAVESSRLLEDLALGRDVQLFYSGLTRDRYDRALAHVATTDQSGPTYWLNMEMVKQGGARVRVYPDTAAFGEDFLAAENTARLERTGLWSKQAYKLVPAANITAEWRGFTLVEVRFGPRRAPPEDKVDRLSCQREAVGSGLVVEIRREASDLCAAPEGTPYRLRGWISNQRLDLTLPLHAEPLN